ncbi:MAG TPA: hypothetical protein VI168_17240, partial [Croceibacterium sp.]
MAIDNDLSALLPDPPPPRPARREAAVEEALRRFDGHGPTAPERPVGARPASGHAGWGRPQIAALASVALVVVVSVPIWWTERDRLDPADPRIAPPTVVQDQPAAAPTPGVVASQQPAEPVPTATGRPAPALSAPDAVQPPPPPMAMSDAGPPASSADSLAASSPRQ